MAKTLVGMIVLKLQENVSKGAGAAAGALGRLGVAVENLSKRGAGFNRLASDAKKLNDDLTRLGNAPWGARMQSQLERLGAGAKDIERVRAEWNRLISDINSKGLKKGAANREIANWRAATIGHFTAVRMEAERTKRSIANLMKPVYTAAGLGTGAYVAGRLGRAGITASSELQREFFRQDMAGISEPDQAKLRARALELSNKYQSAGLVNTMTLGRSAYPMMGGMDRGLEVLEAMTKSFVTLQSAKGVDVAITELNGLLRGIDNLGKNEKGLVGVKDTIDIINGITKAVQMEGRDFDAGKLFQFARRAKIAGPQLSTDFIVSAAPVLMQDQTPEGFGTALSSAYKAFVIGASDSASGQDLGSQAALGLRDGFSFKKDRKGKDTKTVETKGSLVGRELFATNPFEWTKQYLIPALERSGIDMTNDSQVTEAVARLSRNSLATGMLTRMILQRENIEKNMEFQKNAMGISAADKAAKSDPFVAYEGFLQGLSKLASSVGILATPTITAGLVGLADGFNSIATAITGMDPEKMKSLGTAITALAGLTAAGGGAFLAVKGIMNVLALANAGPKLILAADALTVAAGRLGAAAGIPGAPDVGGGKGKGKGLLGKLLNFAKSPAGAGLAVGGALIGAMEYYGDEPRPDGSPTKRAASSVRAQLLADRASALKGSDEDLDRGETNRQRALGASSESVDQAVRKAEQAGQKIESSLSVTAKPNVDTSSLENTLNITQQIEAALSRIGAAARGVQSQIGDALRSTYSDYGVSP